MQKEWELDQIEVNIHVEKETKECGLTSQRNAKSSVVV